MKKKLKKIVKNSKFLQNILIFFTDIRDYSVIRDNRNYEKAISNIIGGEVMVKLRNIPGEYFIDARSHILKRILLTKEYEPEIVNLILKNAKPNKDAVNVGANIGLYTNLLANNLNEGKKTLAIEPTSHAFNSLNNNISQNNNNNKVIVFKGIATDKKGNYTINTVQGKEEYSSIGKLVHSSVKNDKIVTEEVLGNTIDNLVDQYNLEPSLIVIDTEGAELNVLKGAIKTLKKHHPVIISEVDDKLLFEQNADSKQIINFLQELNYKVTDTENNYPHFPFCGNIVAST